MAQFLEEKKKKKIPTLGSCAKWQQQQQRQVPSQRRDIHRRKIEILIFAKSRSDEKRENILFDFFSRKKMRRAKISQSLKSTEIIRRKSELKSWQYFFNLT